MTLLRYLWAFPATLVGLLLAALALAGGGRARLRGGTLEVAGGALGRGLASLDPRWSFSAITFGHVIYAIDPALLEGCRAHERVHVRQYERWGMLFFPLYLGSSLLALARGEDPYRDNRFEREAFREAGRNDTIGVSRARFP